jgi:hypothetical protein
MSADRVEAGSGHAREPHDDRGLQRLGIRAQNPGAFTARPSWTPKACALPLRYTPTVSVRDWGTQHASIATLQEPTVLQSHDVDSALADPQLADGHAARTLDPGCRSHDAHLPDTESGQAHHHAQPESDGVDPELANWVRPSLQAQIGERLGNR